MEYHQKLNVLLSELEQLTGIHMNIISDTPEEADTVIEQLQRLCSAYKEKYNKEYFLKNIACHNLSVAEVERQASHYRIDPHETRVPLLLETKNLVDQTILTILKHLIPARNNAFLVPVTDHLVLLLLTITEKEHTEELLKSSAQSFIEALNVEAFTDARIAFGPVLRHLSELSSAFSKMTLTLSIGRIFYSEQTVFFYNHLGVSRLIHELPISVCDDFLDEIFVKGVPDLDFELNSVTDCFFENNLNIAETARQLHMHRNTLIYRLDQLEQMTGLNLRTFEDAMLFKIALMIIRRRQSHE